MPVTLHIYVPLHFYCDLHTDPKLLHISIQNQSTVIFIYHIIAQYVPVVNMPLKCHKYDIYNNVLLCLVCSHKIFAPI